MANPAADFPAAAHTATDASALAALALGASSPTHTQLEGKQEAELVAVTKRLLGTPINVLEYGADPTAVADSTAAIQAAMDAGDSVAFPAGTYRLSDTLFPNNGQTLIFHGAHFYAPFAGPAFHIQAAEDFETWLGRLEIDCANVSGSTGVLIGGAGGASTTEFNVIQALWVSNADIGLHMYSDGTQGVFYNRIEYFVAYGCGVGLLLETEWDDADKTGTCATGGSTSSAVLAASASATNNAYQGMEIVFADEPAHPYTVDWYTGADKVCALTETRDNAQVPDGITYAVKLTPPARLVSANHFGTVCLQQCGDGLVLDGTAGNSFDFVEAESNTGTGFTFLRTLATVISGGWIEGNDVNIEIGDYDANYLLDTAGIYIATIADTELDSVDAKFIYTPSMLRSIEIRNQQYSYHYGRASFDQVVLGAHYLWVDATGDLRIKSSAPSSDTDGTVVGTQS